jgi:hypothetical protein
LLAAVDGRIVLHFGRGGGVEHNKNHAFGRWRPHARQTVSVALTVGIHSCRRGIAFCVAARNHASGVCGIGQVEHA